MPGMSRRPERGAGHPKVAAAVLMASIVVGIVAISLLGALGR